MIKMINAKGKYIRNMLKGDLGTPLRQNQDIKVITGHDHLQKRADWYPGTTWTFAMDTRNPGLPGSTQRTDFLPRDIGMCFWSLCRTLPCRQPFS